MELLPQFLHILLVDTSCHPGVPSPTIPLSSATDTELCIPTRADMIVVISYLSFMLRGSKLYTSHLGQEKKEAGVFPDSGVQHRARTRVERGWRGLWVCVGVLFAAFVWCGGW